MRIKFEKDDNGCSHTLCPHGTINTICFGTTFAGSWICQNCEHHRGTEGNEVICGREEE